MKIKNEATRYSQEFKESIISLSQIGLSANSLTRKYNLSVLTISK